MDSSGFVELSSIASAQEEAVRNEPPTFPEFFQDSKFTTRFYHFLGIFLGYANYLAISLIT
jgi:hypothetical protein